VFKAQEDWQAGTVDRVENAADGMKLAVRTVITNKYTNHSFDNGLSGWNNGYDRLAVAAPGEGYNGGNAAKVVIDKNDPNKNESTLSQTLTGFSLQPKTLYVRARCKANFTEHPGSRDINDWSIYFDVLHKDGTNTFNALQYGDATCAFDPASTDWQEIEVRWKPSKPIDQIRAHCICRLGYTGVVWWDAVLCAEVDDEPGSKVSYPYVEGTTSIYHSTGTWTSQPIDLSSVGVAAASAISWQADTPPGTAVTVEASLDGGQTWQPCTNGGPVPGIVPGMDPADKNLLVRAALATADATVTPVLHDLTVRVVGQAKAIKHYGRVQVMGGA